jgi:hypothetical protein
MLRAATCAGQTPSQALVQTSAAQAPPPRPARQLTPETALGQAIFLRLNQWCRDRGIPLLVLTTGFQAYYLQPPLRGAFYDLDFLQQAAEFFAGAGIPFHNSISEMDAAVTGKWEGYLIPIDGHPNSAGAQLFADHAWKWLGPQLHQRLTP